MAIRGAVRWKPDTYRSSIEATVIDLDPSTTPPGGTIVLIAQAVAYDDAVFGGGAGQVPYRPGDPQTERQIVVLHEQVRQYDLAAAHTMTQQQITAFLTGELNAYRAWILPAGPALVKAFYAARMAPPVLVQ